MKRFTFRLETLLEHRKILEKLRDQEFAAAQGRHELAMSQLDALEAHYQQTIADRPAPLVPQIWGEGGPGTPFDAPAILSREKYLEAVQIQIGQQRERVEIARLIAEEMWAAMVAAKQAREAVSRLRDKDFADYKAEAQRKAQESMDEIASVQFVRQQIADSLQRTETADRLRHQTEAKTASGTPDPNGRKAA